MLFLSFEDWRENEIEKAFESDELIECPDCKGEGVNDEECSHCGRDSAIACEACDGDGEIELSSMNDTQARKVFTKSEYLKIIKLEFSKWASFTGKNESEIYFENGFVAHCQVKSREIRLS